MKWIIYPVLMGIGIILGRLIGNIPYVTFVKDVRLGELGTFLTSLSVAFVIPYSVHVWTEKRRNLKGFIESQLMDFHRIIKTIKEKIESYNTGAPITEDEKKWVQLKFTECDNAISNWEMLFKEHVKDKHLDEMFIQIKETYHTWWKSVTGGDFMSTPFTVEVNFLREQSGPFTKCEHEIRKAILKFNCQ